MTSLLLAVTSSYAVSAIDIIELDNQVVSLQLTPAAGGRVLSFALKDQPNFLKVNKKALLADFLPVNEYSEHIGYLGHEMWVGPQQNWWAQQTLNQERATEKSVWPPDPFLAQAENELLKHSKTEVTLLSMASPVSHVQLKKTFQLVKGKPNTIKLLTEARNIAEHSVSWDLWFNTRVAADTYVYAPLALESDLRVDQITDSAHDGIQWQLENGLFHLHHQAPSEEKNARRGKAYLQPAAGWMAGFKGQQAFIIYFPLVAAERIHPAQAQVELYLEFSKDALAEGLLEMELHTPYQKLQPGEVLHGYEYWTLLPYEGEHTPAAHSAFLARQLPELLNSLN